MDPGGSLPCLQNPTAGPYSKVDESNLHLHSHTHTHTHYVLEVHFNIILPSMSSSPKLFTNKNSESYAVKV
jgi:hypothetical protein